MFSLKLNILLFMAKESLMPDAYHETTIVEFGPDQSGSVHLVLHIVVGEVERVL